MPLVNESTSRRSIVKKMCTHKKTRRSCFISPSKRRRTSDTENETYECWEDGVGFDSNDESVYFVIFIKRQLTPAGSSCETLGVPWDSDES